MFIVIYVFRKLITLCIDIYLDATYTKSPVLYYIKNID